MKCHRCLNCFANKSNLNRHIKSNICDNNKRIIINKDGKNNKDNHYTYNIIVNDFYDLPKLSDLENYQVRYIIHQDKYIDRLVHLIYVNNPKYKNIKMTPELCYIYNNNTWSKLHWKNICKIIMETCIKILLDYLMKNRQDINNKCFNMVIKYLYDKYNNNINILKSIRLILINNR